MIIRNAVSRQGRRALASTCTSIRTLTGTTAPPPTPFKHLTPETVSKTAGTEFIAMQDIKRSTGHLGSDIAPFYQPHKALTAPLGPKDVTLELLMASQAHMGHSTSLWHPANQRYIYGIRAGIHIISLEATAAHLRRAAKVVEGVAYHGGTILFVGTRKGQMRAVVKAARLAGGCHLFDRWIPGAITNGDQILAGSRIKVVDQLDREYVGPRIQKTLGEHRALKPDLVVCLNPLENYICLRECGLAGVPTIGVIDTDTNPTWVTYPIPANDDSLRCIQLIAGVLGRAGEIGQKKRKEAAERGQIEWESPEYLMELIGRDRKEAQEAQKVEL